MQTFKLRHRAKGRTLLAILISVIYILADAAFGYMIFPYINVHYRRGSNTFAYLVVLPLIGLPFLVSLLYPSYTVRIDVAEEQLVKKFTDVPVRLLFLSESLEAEGEAPKISFDVSGTVPTLEDYELSDGAVYADCSTVDKTGIYDLPVHIMLPSYFQIESQSAETVSVAIRTRREAQSETGDR